MTETHELVPFLAVHAARYQEDYGLNGLHPTHYDLMVKYGARMVDFNRATNAPGFKEETRRCAECTCEKGEAECNWIAPAALSNGDR